MECDAIEHGLLRTKASLRNLLKPEEEYNALKKVALENLLDKIIENVLYFELFDNVEI